MAIFVSHPFCCGLVPWQLFGYGRSDRSTKLTRGLISETPAGFRSRRGSAMTTQHLSSLTMLLSRHTRRRDLITLLGAAATWPLAVRAQQPSQARRIGMVRGFASDDPGGQARLTAFAQGLQQLGWTDGRNVRIEGRWGAGDAERYRRYAAELVALAPDVILVGGGSILAAVQNATRTVPIVFVSVTDPVGAGYVASLARPGANTTGFTLFEYGTSGKWLELLKEIAPGVMRAAVIQDPSITSGTGQLAAIQAVASSLGVELTPVDVRDASGIEHSIATFTPGSNCGLIVTISP